MHSVLLDIFGVKIYSYGFFVALGALLAVGLAILRGKKEGLEPVRIIDLALLSLISGVVGAKIYLLVKEPDYYFSSFDHFISLLRSGGVILGGLILAIIVTIWYVKKHKLGVWKVVDIAAPSIILGQAVGRIGCFLAGCCYGKVCTGALGVSFSDPTAHELTGVPLNVPLHPTQLYHSLTNFLIFALLMLFYKKRKFIGQIFLSYAILYSIGRFVIEFFRGDKSRITIGGPLSDAQYLCIIAFVSAVIVMIIKLKKIKAT